MAKQSLEWADTNKDGRVTKEEYMSGQARLAELDNRQNNVARNEERWATIDAADKGWVNETELKDGLSKIAPVRVGHLEPGFAERLRNPRA